MAIHRINNKTKKNGALALSAFMLAGIPTVFMLTTAQTAEATPTSQLQSEKTQLQNELAQVQQELDEATNNYDTALNEKQSAEQAVNDAKQQKADAEANMNAIQEKLNNRCVNMYKNNEKASLVSVILGTDNLDDMLNAIAAMTAINAHDAAAIDESKQLQSEIAQKQAEAEEAQAIAEQKTAEAEEIKNNAQSKADEYKNKINSVDASIRQQVQEAAQAQAASNAGSDSSARSGAGSSIPANGDVISYAQSRLGCPYVWGGSGPNGFDCSGLVMWCYAQTGKSLPHNSESMKASAAAIIPVSEAQPGDVLYRPGHVGLCLTAGGGSYIHAPTTGDVVKIASGSSWSCALRF